MKKFTKRVLTGLSLGALFWIAFAYLPAIYFSWILFAIVVQISVFEWRNFFDMRHPLFWAILPWYPILPFTLLILMNNNPIYHNLLFVLFILVSSHDTGSYFVGSFFGRHKIAPSISPGKTWEGFFGGVLFASIGLWLVLREIHILKSPLMIITFASFVCILALCGDLFESWLKRRAGIKDSGDILPGHGGFLDRFDGILFAVFFFYFYRNYLVSIFS
jgi:phosphatidate cytidylyltransferase